jgi:5'-deoxynucleotidase YfbR-like HD superfamily hydrolase
MNHLTNLFKLLQVTRTQPQYGYALSGLKKHELSNLAEHHYLVAFIAWQIAASLNDKGAKLNVEKVLALSMLHDLGELFGGDISRHYGLRNPKARKLAKTFEAENHKFLLKFFQGKSYNYRKLFDEIMESASDEGVVAKVADYMECAHYLKYLDKLTADDEKVLGEMFTKILGRMKDKNAKKELGEYLKTWLKELPKQTISDVVFANA